MAFGKDQLIALKKVQENAKKKGDAKTVPVIRAFAVWSVLHSTGSLTAAKAREIFGSRAKTDATLFQQVRKLLTGVAEKYGWPKDVGIPVPKGKQGGRARMTDAAMSLASDVDVDSWILEAESEMDDFDSDDDSSGDLQEETETDSE